MKKPAQAGNFSDLTGFSFSFEGDVGGSTGITLFFRGCC
jgi:hypothetical protein